MSYSLEEDHTFKMHVLVWELALQVLEYLLAGKWVLKGDSHEQVTDLLELGLLDACIHVFLDRLNVDFLKANETFSDRDLLFVDKNGWVSIDLTHFDV